MELFEMAQKIKLVQTCGACPEQYDAYIDDERIGYLRLRHGYFSVEYPWVGGEVVYSVNTNGDGLFDDGEREGHLAAARLALIKKHKEVTDEERI